MIQRIFFFTHVSLILKFTLNQAIKLEFIGSSLKKHQLLVSYCKIWANL